MKRIVVQNEPEVCKMALVEDHRLVEIFFDRLSSRQRAGNIYKGKVVNVLPGMQAAFVDIGQGKNAFLFVDDLLPAHAEKQPKEKPGIEQLVRVGEELLVQVAKEPAGSKGARVTTQFTLPGRWLVYMPGADYVGVSRKLESESERGRLKKIGEDIRRPGEGLIVRTLAKGASRQDLEQDLNALRNTWSDIMRLEKFSSAPCEVYRDLDMALRWVRDLLTEEVDDLWVDDPKTADTILRFVKQLMPDLSDRIKLYEGKEPLFRHFGLEEEIEKMFASKIWLKNGGYLVVDHTEALTVIDVNTGKYTGTSDPEETMFRTNLEAAEEIGRLIRLRDIGGIIIADFIDMDSREYRDRIVKTLQESMKKDRTRSVVVGWTRLGLLEITRKKVRENMKNQITETCPGAAAAVAFPRNLPEGFGASSQVCKRLL